MNDVKIVLLPGGALSAASREMFKSLEDGFDSLDCSGDRLLLQVVESAKDKYRQWNTSFEPIWQAVGHALVEYCGEVAENELAHIAHHCARLKKLDLMKMEELVFEDTKKVIDLLQELKTLRVLMIVSDDYEASRRLSTDQLRMIVAACPPSVKIHADVSTCYELGVSNFIRGIGTHLQGLKLEGYNAKRTFTSTCEY